MSSLFDAFRQICMQNESRAQLSLRKSRRPPSHTYTDLSLASPRPRKTSESQTMASIAFPQYSKHLSLSTTHTYNYVYIPTNKAPLPTILFLHGFPSSSYDWRHQISFFAAHGYGVLAPDLLGYGGTSKPAAVEGYKTKKMAAEIAEILDHENLTRVHAVAHDTGCILLSRLVNYFPQKIHSCTFLAVPYSRPGEHFDLDAVNAMTKQILGHEQFGYLKLFVSDGSDYLLDEHASCHDVLLCAQRNIALT